MSRNDQDEMTVIMSWVKKGTAALVLLLILLLGGCPAYNVWEKRMQGKAVLAEAESSRQVTIQEAKAKKESAEMLAEAEIIRARGVAKANAIIGDSLKGNEAYLHYLWIHNLETTKDQIIYIPTEANLPVLESHRGVK